MVVGRDPRFEYRALRHAADAVRRGAFFVATNADATVPSASGLLPEAGALLAAIDVASGRTAEVIGKPNRPMMQAAAALLTGTRCIAVIGDRPDTDVADGRAMGRRTILVFPGVTSSAQARCLDPQPDLILHSIAEFGIARGCMNP
ncbi:MAG: HAD-superfamily hydrolase, subfamily [Chloroflexi bacterium]|nr:HAD-superfamily hydrolase, subfamily [Chloroflexota bacterium]